MKYLILVSLTLFLIIGSSSAQNNDEYGYIIHKVQQGETLYSIGKNYEVNQKDLLNDNPELISGLKAGQELKIRVSQNENIQVSEPQPKVTRQPSFEEYKVKRKDTLYGIAKDFGIEIDDIIKYNPEAENGIEKRQILRIPDKTDLAQIKAEEAKQEAIEAVTIHKVMGDETLYAISQKYNVSIASILALNPDAKSSLPIGMELTIPSPEASIAMEEEVIVANTPTEKKATEGEYFTYLVESGDTYWGLEKKYNTTQAELEDLNPILLDGLKAGFKIRIPLYNLPEVEAIPVDEDAFTDHFVNKGETLYSISKKYDVKISELKNANPVLKMRGLMAGETILIPKIERIEPVFTEAVVEPVIETEDQLPQETNEGVGEGTAQVIEKQPDTIIEEPTPSLLVSTVNDLDYTVEVKTEAIANYCPPDPFAASETYQVGLLLPLYLNANDTVNRIRITPEELMEDSTFMSAMVDTLYFPVDTFRWREDEIIYPRSANFMNFYEGVLLAVDSLQKSGFKVEMNVFDTNYDKQVVDSLIQLDIFRELDLIIGPVYPELQSSVADFAYKNRIPMVSPLSASGNIEESNPYYYKVNPTKNYLIKATANYINDEFFGDNLTVLQVGEYQHLPEVELVDLCREKFFNSGYNGKTDKLLFHEYNYQTEGSMGLSRIAYKNQNNVFIIPSSNEAQVTVGVDNLNSLSDRYPVTLVGLSNFNNYSNIQVEYFHNTNLTILTPYYIDYKSPVTNNFIQNYREMFAAEPTQYSYQGYDIAFYFISALANYGKDFRDCLPSLHVDLTQTDFYFEQVSRMGGYMNRSLFITKYTPDFEVITTGKVGRPVTTIYTADR